MVISGQAHVEDLLSLLRSREAAIEIRQFAARGVLPLESDDRIRALFAVLKDTDPSIVIAARETLAEFPPDMFADFLRGERVSAVEIEAVSSLTDDSLVLEQIVRHRNVSDETLLKLGRSLAGGPQEALVVNQVRLLANPALIDALYSNPQLTSDNRRMLNELREEFFEKETRRREARQAEEEAAKASAAPPAASGPLSAADAADLDEDDDGSPTPPGAPDPQEAVSGAEEAYLRIMRLTVPERVKLALRGSKEERRFLIGDTSRMVCLAVLRARGLTITEVESFCSMRHLEPEVFHAIARKRDWIRRTGILQALVRNPKVPLSITMPLVLRLSMRELRNIARDRNLPEAIRSAAKRTYLQRRK
ncbi:MAG TPA: hypothetical protein VKH43_03425 [Thermoanaerobaculia bacterium]|nr:hypothetical protein [Thermoanaerobaculia bacterium]